MSLSGTVPNHAKYVQGGLPIGLDSKRRIIRLLPQTGTGKYNPNGTNVIRIDIPPSIGFLDTQNSYLRFRIKVDQTNVDMTKPCYMDKNAMSWVDRFECISNNGSVLESIHDYNLLVNLLHKSTSPDDYRLTTGKLLDNQGSRSERMANVAPVEGRMYCCGLDASGIFGGNTKYLPCQFIQGSLTLEFTLAQFNDCFVGQSIDNGTASYQIDNVEYIAECITFGQDYNYLFERQLRERGIDIAFHSYRSHHHALQQATDQVIQLAQNSKSVKGSYCVIRDVERYRSGKFESLSRYKSGRIEEYQFDLGGRMFPEFPIRVTDSSEAVCYASNLNSYNHFRDHNGGSDITRETFAPHNKCSLIKPTDTCQYTNSSQVTARFHGFLVGNTESDNIASFGNGASAPTAFTDANVEEKFITSTIFFRPSSLFDLKDIKLGDRVKVCLINDTDSTLDNLTAATADENLHGSFSKNTAHQSKEKEYADNANVKSGAEGKEHTYLFVVGVGLDVVRKYKSDISAGATAMYETFRGCVALARTRDGINEAGMDTNESMMAVEIKGFEAKRGHIRKSVKTGVAGDTDTTAVEVVDQAYGYDNISACFLDRIPDDRDFYIGQSFETHEEHETMISGTDLTQTVPLHINLKFGDHSNALGFPNAPVKQGDLLTCFIHYDAVLRIEPSGEVVSSM